MQQYLEDLGHRAEWVICPACRQEWNALTEDGSCIGCVDKRRQDELRQVKLGDYLKKTIGSYGIERYGFGSWDQAPENRYAFTRFSAFNPAKDNLFVYGPCGTGKTHLAGALLKAVCGMNLTVQWVNPIYVTRSLRSRFPSEEEAFVESIISHDVLIIDDLGIGKDTDTTLRMIYEIVDKRKHRSMNGLVITSNLSLDALAHNYKDDRIASRIAGMCEIIQIGGTDRRNSR